MFSKENCRNELRTAIRQLSDRCLHSASKWAAEQLVGIEQDPAKFTPSNTRFQRGSSSIRRRFRTNDVTSTPVTGVSYVSTPVMEEDEVVDGDFYLLAKSYFDCREYRRAAHVLRDQTGKKSIFLRCYALYLAGEKRKEEEMIELEGPLGKSDAVNRELVSLERELSTLRKSGTIDPFGLYLYGLVLKEKGSENLARMILVESVNSYPWNWNAWSELQSLCTTIDILSSLNLNNHWMKDFFLASAYQELRMHNESLAKYEYLQGTFSFSNYIQAQIAKAQYSLREFDQVEVIFEELLRNDPYRVEDMDMYSNVLYAKECFSALSYLAHRVFMTDKYRPESCCIIGNYYSLKGQHEKSVMYFRRALKLNKNYLSAWTLMGHEYVEMKNTPAAIDAYRRAVDINPCDYRAWYGLGQTYEMMGMPFYALHYFRKSVFLQPSDSRLWIAMAQCYETEQLHMLEEAIKCYRRAAHCNDREAIALHQLAKLHQKLGRNEEAAFYYEKDLAGIGREERYNLWFDPSDDFHQYSILWTDSQIIFYIDNVPIREVKRTASMGGDFPSKPMSLYATIWDGSDWATNGGKYRVNYKYAPYVAYFSDFILHGCAVDPIEQFAVCDNSQSLEAIDTEITRTQRSKMESLRRKHMTYSYCYDQTRYKVPPAECVINPAEAERLKVYDPVTFGGSRRHHGKRRHRTRSVRSEADSI